MIEKSALQIDFDKRMTVLAGGNKFGKSAVIKSLYETLGAVPAEIDAPWKAAKVACLLEFEIDGKRFSALKNGKSVTIFNDQLQPLISTSQMTSELAPFYADLFDFRLVTNIRGKVGTPWPSYIFIPFYQDQDRWNDPWKSFVDLRLPRSIPMVTEFHSGLRPNEYYEAQAQRDALKIEEKELALEASATEAVLRRLQEVGDGPSLNMTIAEFSEETTDLLRQASLLRKQQADFRTRMSYLSEEIEIWKSQIDVITLSLCEMNETLGASLKQPSHVDCPVCGQDYENGIAAQFGLVEDQDALMAALDHAKQRQRSAEDDLASLRKSTNDIELAIDRVAQILAIKKYDVTLSDVLVSQGRHEAVRAIKQNQSDVETRRNTLAGAIASAERQMRTLNSKKRRQEITSFFSTEYASLAERLGTRYDIDKPIKISVGHVARGSEGPRGAIAFRYALLKTAVIYGSSSLFPVVVDEPNQQGPDAEHLEKIVRLVLSDVPTDDPQSGESGQSIVAVVSPPEWYRGHVVVMDNGEERGLRSDQFEHVVEYMRPYIQGSIF